MTLFGTEVGALHYSDRSVISEPQINDHGNVIIRVGHPTDSGETRWTERPVLTSEEAARFADEILMVVRKAPQRDVSPDEAAHVLAAAVDGAILDRVEQLAGIVVGLRDRLAALEERLAEREGAMADLPM